MMNDNEKRLYETEVLYQSLVNLSPYAIFVHTGGKYVFANSQALKLLAASSPAEIVGKDVMEFVHPDYHQLVAERNKQVYSGSVTPPRELKLIRLDGVVIDAETRGAPAIFEGKPAVQIVTRDITEHKMIEKLNTTLNRFNEVINSSLDIDGNLNIAMDQALKAMECSVSEIILWENDGWLAKYLSNMIVYGNGIQYQSDRVLFYNLVAKSKQILVLTDTNKYLTKHQFHSDELTRSLIVSPLMYQEKFMGVVSFGFHEKKSRFSKAQVDFVNKVSYSISMALQNNGLYKKLINELQERQRVEELLKEEEKRFSAFMDNTTTFAWMKDEFGRYVYLNKKFERYYNVSTGDWLGKTDFEIWPHESAEIIYENDQKVLRAAYPIEFEEETSILNNERRTWLSFKFPFNGRLGRKYIGGVGIEITERKQAEEALRKSEELYRALVSELREVDNRKNQFLAVLSHELRNPLGAISNGLSILDHVPVGGEQAKGAIAIINRQVGQLSHLVDDLLDITRINQNKIHLQRKRTELNELVKRVIEDHRILFNMNNVTLQVELAPSLIFVNADETRLAQVIGNLLTNAAKFTPRDFSTRVSLENDLVQRQGIIRVSDTGIGMEPETISRLFQPFMQVDNSLARNSGGLGLGLALSKGIIEMHGGDISAYSDGLGKGSDFLVRLPLVGNSIEELQVTPSDIAHHRRRILIIDDNIDLTETLRELLELTEHEVAVSYTGLEGIDKAREFRPEIVLCDIGLPGMNGYEVAKVFRTDEMLKDTFLIAFSGYASPEDIHRAKEVGFNLHLAKPVSLGKLEPIFAQVFSG